MVIMAIDHVRDYFHADAFVFDPSDISKTSLPVFFTRFITHYCAPVFMLLSGTSACLVGMRKGKKALSTFLFTRGLWLIVLELTVVNFGWFFDPQINNIGFLVIWALGMSMIFLSAMIYLPKSLLLFISLAMIAGHNYFDSYHVTGNTAWALVWSILHEQTFVQAGGKAIGILYPLVPWIGVMSLGYCIGSLYDAKVAVNKRQRFLLWSGIGCVLMFIALRYANWYGDKIQWSEQSTSAKTLMSFLSLSKYPPSLLFLLVTLGPALMLLSLTERTNGWISQRLQVIGRVPMFFYLVHIYLIHLAAMMAVELTSGHDWSDMLLTTWVVFEPKLKGYGIGLGAMYLVWFALVVILYLLCRRYDKYKRTHKHWWLSYL